MDNLLKNYIIVALFMVTCSCSSDLDDMSKSKDKPDEAVQNNYEMIVKEWGTSLEYVEGKMSSSRAINNSENDIRQYKVKNGQSISYLFSNGELCASAILFPYMGDFEGEDILRGYNRLGYLDGNLIYANDKVNTMAMILNPCDADSTHSSLVFAPIDTELFTNLYPVHVSTGDVSLNLFVATASATISGAKGSVEVGFIYGSDQTLSSGKELTVSTKSNNEFTLSMSGLVDQQTYYYRSYAIVEGVRYYGEIKSFVTDKLYYQINGGSAFEMIVVDNGTMQPFSIMQTELPLSAVLTINGKSFNPIDSNGDNCVTEYELVKYCHALANTTGMIFRQPTVEEWQYAAKGGNKSHGWQYSGSNNLDDVAWYKANSGAKLHEPALKAPNELMLYDMNGNYGEVCLNEIDPANEPFDADGPICGGCWNDNASYCTTLSTKENSSSTSYISGTHVRELYAFDGRYCTVRLVATRP